MFGRMLRTRARRATLSVFCPPRSVKLRPDHERLVSMQAALYRAMSPTDGLGGYGGTVADATASLPDYAVGG